GFVHQGGKNADGGRLTGAIGAQQSVEIALGHIQVDAFQRLEAVTVNLGQLPDRQSISHKCTHNTGKKTYMRAVTINCNRNLPTKAPSKLSHTTSCPLWVRAPATDTGAACHRTEASRRGPPSQKSQSYTAPIC